ncbi:MAG: hypothetical protein OXK17_08385 [Thaumarchaeota archaeon]|nr:hypothetical protein [Nitrososphaerota archaeon]
MSTEKRRGPSDLLQSVCPGWARDMYGPRPAAGIVADVRFAMLGSYRLGPVGEAYGFTDSYAHENEAAYCRECRSYSHSIYDNARRGDMRSACLVVEGFAEHFASGHKDAMECVAVFREWSGGRVG